MCSLEISDSDSEKAAYSTTYDQGFWGLITDTDRLNQYRRYWSHSLYLLYSVALITHLFI